MKLTFTIINTLLLAVIVTSAPTQAPKKQSKIKGHKHKAVDQEAQPSDDSGLRNKRGSHHNKHYLHILKPVQKLKTFQISHGNYHEHEHKEPHDHHHSEEVQHTYSETHEHVHHDHEEKHYEAPKKVEVYQEHGHEIQGHEIYKEAHEHVPLESQHYYEEEHKEQIKVKHHHHHHHHNHIKTIIKKVPEPYPVEKVVHVPVEKIVHVPKPYPVEKVVEKVIRIPIEKIIHVPKPYPVEKIIEKPIEIERKVPVEVKVPYPVEKVVHVPVERIVEKIVHVPKPYPVEKIVEKVVHVPRPYPVVKPVPYPVEVKVPFHIPKPNPYPIEVAKKNPIYLPPPQHEPFKFDSPIMYDSFDKDYSSLDSKLHQVRVPPNTANSRDQSAVQSNSYQNFAPIKGPRYATAVQFTTGNGSPRALQAQQNQTFSGSGSDSVDHGKQVAETNIRSVAIASNNGNSQQFRISVPDNVSSQGQQLLAQSSDLIAQVHPLQTFQLVQLQPF